MTNTIQVSNNIWEWISTTVPTLNENSRNNLAKWKSGEKQPTFNQLENFSKETHIPIGYFFLTNPPTENLKILEFRTVNSLNLQNPSRDLIDIVNQMENVQEWMHEYIISSQNERVTFVGSLNICDSVEYIADKVRKALALPLKWYEKSNNIDTSFKTLRQAISNMGIIIMMSGIVGSNTHRQLNIEEFRAFTLIDEYAPLIFINYTDSRSGCIFSLVHEFIHIGIGTNSLFNAGINNKNHINKQEILCNAVTAEILVPISMFKTQWQNKSGINSNKIAELADLFKCNQVIIARRALDNNLITNDEYSKIVDQANQEYKNKQKNSGGDYYTTQANRIDHRFLLALDTSLHEARTLHTEAFRLTNTNRITFEKLIDKVRGKLQ